VLRAAPGDACRWVLMVRVYQSTQEVEFE